MSVMTRLVSRIFDLPPAVATKIECQTDIRVPMADGAVLYASRFFRKEAPGSPSSWCAHRMPRGGTNRI